MVPLGAKSNTHPRHIEVLYAGHKRKGIIWSEDFPVGSRDKVTYIKTVGQNFIAKRQSLIFCLTSYISCLVGSVFPAAKQS